MSFILWGEKTYRGSVIQGEHLSWRGRFGSPVEELIQYGKEVRGGAQRIVYETRSRGRRASVYLVSHELRG